jgi:hypothetical protein
MVPPIGQIRASKLRALAVTTATRPEALSLREFVPGSEASAWFGIDASKRTPEPKLQTRLTNLGGTVLGRSSADLAKLISDEEAGQPRAGSGTKRTCAQRRSMSDYRAQSAPVLTKA